ncbi:hypothetical protein [Nannocystis pusilla]
MVVGPNLAVEALRTDVVRRERFIEVRSQLDDGVRDFLTTALETL